MSHRHLTAEGLSVRFGEHEVLRGTDLDIPRGGRLALLGANGSGKTTLLRTLSGAIRPGEGRVLVDGAPVAYDRRGLRAHRQVVQFVAQNPDDQLFAADVQRDVSFGPVNLGLPEDEVRRRVDEALGVLSIADLAERPIHELSYGQRKRVAIAGALAMKPCLILLDEPTAGLDPQGVDEMVAALESLLRARTTVVISTHEVDFALWWADSVAVLESGAVRHGGPAALLSDEDLVGRARLRQPMVLQAAARLGLDPAGIRDVAGLVDAVRAAQEQWR
ncbi:energy-coupling factor ABC transporter ATP-binding protein [Propionicicella superfundia]|uniref:energy-coupling factor ABC transporter ATP-binding protein n=1 Tax=Propionicicella superfundia TaxID=348582 RepID=UPI0004018641|nr:ATP-binding cassette domain-containing protein [Propionicicella superfundia]